MMKKILAGAVVLLCIMAISMPIVNALSSEYDNLKKGDLVYRSGAMGFGHVGIYIGDGKVIEVNAKKAVPPYGVAREISLEDFKKEGKYWGAKTVPGLDEKECDKIVGFAKKTVDETKEGKIQYELTGKGSIGKNGRKSFSCVGFSEAAYQSAGIDIVPGDKTFFNYLTPKGQMRSSELKDVPSEIPRGKDLGGIDFSSTQLNYISMFPDQNEKNFNYVMKTKKAEKGDEIINMEDAQELSINSFFTGLTLPESEFWKLLNEKRGELVKDIIKKHPGEIKDVNDVQFVPVTRHWIVPDKVEAYETDNEIYIVNATLNIFSEPVYEQSTYNVVNQGKNYCNFRQVYISLALAQWYKNKYRHSPSLFADFMDSKNLKGLEPKSAWSAVSVWKDYKKSFEEGDYHCWKNRPYQHGDYTITESKLYSGGGVDFMDIKITNMGVMPENLKESLSEAVYSMYAKEGNDYYFGDGLYVYEDIETVTQENNQTMRKTTGFEAIFAITGLLTVVYLIKR